MLVYLRAQQVTNWFGSITKQNYYNSCSFLSMNQGILTKRSIILSFPYPKILHKDSKSYGIWCRVLSSSSLLWKFNFCGYFNLVFKAVCWKTRKMKMKFPMYCIIDSKWRMPPLLKTCTLEGGSSNVSSLISVKIQMQFMHQTTHTPAVIYAHILSIETRKCRNEFLHDFSTEKNFSFLVLTYSSSEWSVSYVVPSSSDVRTFKKLEDVDIY